MVDDVPPSGGVGGSGARWQHKWHPYDDYQNVHHGYMEHLAQRGIVLDSTLSFIETEDGNGDLVEVNLVGIIMCAEEVNIKVDKTLAVDRKLSGQVLVQGALYMYHAWLTTTHPEQELIRYCTAYGLDDLHRHEFDLRTGVETARPRIRLSELPTLGEFIPQAVELGRQAREYQP